MNKYQGLHTICRQNWARRLCLPISLKITESTIVSSEFEVLNVSSQKESKDRWDDWMVSAAQRTWVWANSGRWWRTGKPGMLQSTGLQGVRYNWATKQHDTRSGFIWASLVAQLVKKVLLQSGRPGFNPWVGKIPWKRERLPTPVFWPGQFHGPVHGVTKSQTQLNDFRFQTPQIERGPAQKVREP